MELILESAEGAFLEVGAFVGAILLLFGYINYKKSGAFVAAIQNSKRWQPVLGALLGLTPGCGGAIFVMPLFFKGAVTFGTVIATLVSTMGDASFVLIASQPMYYVLISFLSFLIAILTGYLVDKTNIGPEIIKKYKLKMESRKQLSKGHDKMEHPNYKYDADRDGQLKVEDISHIGHEEGDEIDILLHHNSKGHQSKNTLGYSFTHKGFYLYWIIIAIGLVLGVMELFQVDVNKLAIPNLGIIIGVGGTIFSIIMMIAGKKFLSDDTHEESELKVKSIRETIIHNAQETAFVITWVFIGFLAYELSVLGLGLGDYAAGEASIETFLLATGVISVVIGSLVGLIPGCGPQIIFVSLFSRGLVPFAALLANAISQDGDALFPILAIDRRSALWATLITTIPALVFGLLIYWLEISIDFRALLGF